MNLTRIIALSYAVICLSIAMITAIQQTQPALFFIRLFTIDEKYSLTLAFLLTALLLLLPAFLLLFIINFLRRSKNSFPDITGKTGIILHRKRALYNAVYNFKIIIDDKEIGVVGNGQSLFTELTSGKHSIAIKGFKSSEYIFDLKHWDVLKLETNIKEEGIKANIIIVPSV